MDSETFIGEEISDDKSKKPEELLKIPLLFATNTNSDNTKYYSRTHDNMETNGSINNNNNGIDSNSQETALVQEDNIKQSEELRSLLHSTPINLSAKIDENLIDPIFIQTGQCEDKDSEDKSNTSKKGFKKYLGILLALAAALQYAMSGIIIKILNYHPFNLGVWRFFIMILIPIPFLAHAVLWKKQNVFGEIWPVNKTTWLLLLQAGVGANSLFLVFYGIITLNFADCLVISTSAPVFVTLLAYFFLGEKCGGLPVFTALLALCGVGIISRPPLLTGGKQMDENTIYGVLAAFGSMLLLTVSYVIVRHMRTVHHALMSFTFFFWGFIESLIIAFSLDIVSAPADIKEVALIIASGFLAFLAQTSITLALKYEQSGPVALVRTSEVIFAFVLQFIFLGVNPDLYSIVGTFFVISGVLLTTFRKIVSGLPKTHKYRKVFWLLLI